jgi:hypothetical protein
MRLVLRFGVVLLWWAGGLLLSLAAISLLSGQSPAEVAANTPAWAALALALAAFPAGVSVADRVFPAGLLAPRRLVEVCDGGMVRMNGCPETDALVTLGAAVD